MSFIVIFLSIALLAVLRSWTTVPYVNALLFEGRESILYLIEQMSSVVKKYR